MAGTLTVSGLSAGEPAGERILGPVTITGTAIIGETLDVPLSSGDNTFTIPPGSVACWIIPPPTGTVTLKVRTSANAADAGLPIASGMPFGPYCFPASVPTSLIVNAAAAQSSPLTIVFI
jgi:hypothetical protein